jgi:hypothetical protein
MIFKQLEGQLGLVDPVIRRLVILEVYRLWLFGTHVQAPLRPDRPLNSCSAAPLQGGPAEMAQLALKAN